MKLCYVTSPLSGLTILAIHFTFFFEAVSSGYGVLDGRSVPLQWVKPLFQECQELVHPGMISPLDITPTLHHWPRYGNLECFDTRVSDIDGIWFGVHLIAD